MPYNRLHQLQRQIRLVHGYKRVPELVQVRADAVMLPVRVPLIIYAIRRRTFAVLIAKYGPMSSNPFELLYLERREHMHTREKLKKAEHDRERYARRIRFLQGNQAFLSCELRALRKECEILNHCVDMPERRVLDESRGTQSGEEASAEEAGMAQTDL